MPRPDILYLYVRSLLAEVPSEGALSPFIHATVSPKDKPSLSGTRWRL